MKLIRVKYGKQNTPPEQREYQINGVGPVGTIVEYKKMFPNEKFEIIDKAEKKVYVKPYKKADGTNVRPHTKNVKVNTELDEDLGRETRMSEERASLALLVMRVATEKQKEVFKDMASGDEYLFLHKIKYITKRPLTPEIIEEVLHITVNEVEGDTTQLPNKLTEYAREKGWLKGFEQYYGGKEDKELSDLNQFIGTEGYTDVMGANITDGVKYVMENGYSWFVTDMLVIIKAKFRTQEFLTVELELKGEGAKAKITDGNKHTLYTQEYKITDAKRNLKLYFANNVLMLSNEY